jgi:hypothetical protein
VTSDPPGGRLGLGRSLLAAARRRPVVTLWCAALLYSALTLYGYFHADELGQITGFYAVKLGLLSPASLEWEYAARMRPWLQPALYHLLLQPWVTWLGYDHVVAERALALVQLAWLAALLPLFLVAAPEVDGEAAASPWWRWGSVAAGCLWFVPSMMLRHSSEAFSTSSLAASLGAWVLAERGRRPLAWALVAGALAGLAFEGRFQVGLFVAGFWLALLVGADRRRLGRLLAYAAALVVVLGIGVAVDGWGYGAPTLSAWNYVRENIVNDRAARDFGTRPWHAYFGWGLAYTLNPLLWLWLGRAAVVTWRRPFARALTVGSAVFLLAHVLLAHKEPRFLMPMVPAAVLLMWYMFADLAAGASIAGARLAGTLTYVRVVAVANVVALVGLTTFGLVSDHARVELALRELPAGSTILTGTNFFGDFDAVLDPDPPPRTGYSLPLLKPPRSRLVYAAAPDGLARECGRDPAAYVLLLNRPPRPQLIDRPFRVVSAFPPRPDLVDWSFLRATWRSKVVRCPDFLATLEATSVGATGSR